MRNGNETLAGFAFSKHGPDPGIPDRREPCPSVTKTAEQRKTRAAGHESRALAQPSPAQTHKQQEAHAPPQVRRQEVIRKNQPGKTRKGAWRLPLLDNCSVVSEERQLLAAFRSTRTARVVRSILVQL